MKLSIKLITLTLASLFAISSAHAKDVQATEPKIVGMYFYASWCSSCKTLDPSLTAATVQLKKVPFLLTRFDVSNKLTQHRAGMTAQAMNLGEIYEETGLKTGFVILIDPSTGEEIRRITKDDNAKSIAAIITEEIAKRG